MLNIIKNGLKTDKNRRFGTIVFSVKYIYISHSKWLVMLPLVMNNEMILLPLKSEWRTKNKWIIFSSLLVCTWTSIEPHIQILNGPEVYVHEGSMLNLTCVISPAVDASLLLWSRNGQVSFIISYSTCIFTTIVCCVHKRHELIIKRG